MPKAFRHEQVYRLATVALAILLRVIVIIGFPPTYCGAGFLRASVPTAIYKSF